MRYSIKQLTVSVGLASGILVGIFLLLQSPQPRSVFAAPTVSLIWPLSGSITPDVISITSPFGPRWQASQGRYDYHSGLDIKADLGTPVHAVTNGLVSVIGYLSGDSGLSVIISHPQISLYSAYLHLNSTANISVNDVITQGEVIGYVGNSGTTEFDHLHFEFRVSLTDYPTSTRNPMNYLPRSDVAAPAIQIINFQTDPIFSPTVTVYITVPRAELDLNQISLTLRDRATGVVVDGPITQMVDFNQRFHTGADSLNQNGIQLTPAHFNETATEYALTAYFYNLHALDSFTVTAQAIDLAGHVGTATAIGIDGTPPGPITSLQAAAGSNGVRLSWLAPGDSDFVGRAMTYEVRYTNALVSNFFVWSSAIPLSNPPAPIDANAYQQWDITQTLPWPVYFQMRAYDDEGNVSQFSNAAQAQAFVYLPLIVRH